MPGMELFQKVRIDFEQIYRRGVWQPHGLHETQEKKEVVQLQELMPEIFLISGKRKAVHEFPDSRAQPIPLHAWII